MSRNLGRTTCYFCGDDPVLCEVPRPIAEDEAGPYFGEYREMLVSKATCPSCEAQYLAWCFAPAPRLYDGQWLWECDAYNQGDRAFPGWGRDHVLGGRWFFDLSFRSTFDDEPGLVDLPSYVVETRVVRTRVKRFEIEPDGQWSHLLRIR